MSGGGDWAISGIGAQDATMVDVGERGRPPGDPPDLTVSWALKVSGSNVGGRPNPENLLDDDFVAARLTLDFPNGEDGEPVVTIGSEVLDVMNGLWKRCMIVKVLGRNISISVLTRRLRELWKPKGAMYVMDLPRQFFMIRFEADEEYLSALTGGPWRAFGSYLMVQAWSPEFDPLRDEIVTTPVWVRLSNIPVNFYHKAILLGIAKGLGKPIKVDLTTLNFERARFARICVEVNLKKPLKGTMLINGERYFVSYEGLSNICSLCGMFGHPVHSCPRHGMEKQPELPSARESVALNEDNQVEDGFTAVRRKGSRTAQPQKDTNSGAGGSRGNSGRIMKEVIHGNNLANIAISNSFGNLEEVSDVPTVKETTILSDADKENRPFLYFGRQGKSISQVKERSANGLAEKGKSIAREGPTNRRAGSYKGTELNGPKPKLRSNRPMRGLVFGPTKGEVEMSESGKRLRVESDGVRRAGGVFGNGSGGVHTPPVSLSTAPNEIQESIPMVSENPKSDHELVIYGDTPAAAVDSRVA